MEDKPNSFLDAAEDAEVHNCRVHADAQGECKICGAYVYMSQAYCEAHACDSPEREKWDRDNLD